MKGVPAVTVQAGEQSLGKIIMPPSDSAIYVADRCPLEIYRAAAEKGDIVVGGAARTVGAAGGYVLGGGHSPFAHFYGLAVDSKCLLLDRGSFSSRLA